MEAHSMKTFAIIKDNVVQEVLHIGGGDYQAQITASMEYLEIEGSPVEIDQEMVKGEYFDKSLAPPEPAQEEPEQQQSEQEKNAIRIWQLTGYLISTDWMIVRKIETGKEIPQDILEKRQSAREEISTLRLIE